jgi:branched-subunit amino acid ABC-type transport system permease component
MLSVDPYIGMVFLVRNFFVVIVGGIGQLLGGTLAGSFLIGGAETFFALFATQTFAQTVVFALAIIVLRFWPDGILSGGSRR